MNDLVLEGRPFAFASAIALQSVSCHWKRGATAITSPFAVESIDFPAADQDSRLPDSIMERGRFARLRSIDEWSERMNGSMDPWMDGWMDGWMDERLMQVQHEINEPKTRAMPGKEAVS